MPGFQFYFELIGAVAFAISGAALAVKKHMDLFGVAMMGMTTAVGGGILRDLLLGLGYTDQQIDELEKEGIVKTCRADPQ